MNAKKPLIVAGVATTLAVGGMSLVSADTTSSSSDNPMSSLVDAIASKFNLKKSDVQAVVDANRQQHEQQRQQKMTDKLNQLVSDGKLTSAQKDLIVAKQAEVKTFMDSLKGKSESDRRSAMKTERDNLKSWAQQHNIPTQDLRFVMPFGHGGRGGPGPDLNSDANSDSSN